MRNHPKNIFLIYLACLTKFLVRSVKIKIKGKTPLLSPSLNYNYFLQLNVLNQKSFFNLRSLYRLPNSANSLTKHERGVNYGANNNG